MFITVDTLSEAKRIAKHLRGSAPVLYIAAAGGYCWTVSDQFSTDWAERPIVAIYPNNRTIFEAGWRKVVQAA